VSSVLNVWLKLGRLNKIAAFLMGEFHRCIKLFQSFRILLGNCFETASLDIEPRIRVEVPNSIKVRCLVNCNYVAYNVTSFEDDIFDEVR
jgi:hypothetical protein